MKHKRALIAVVSVVSAIILGLWMWGVPVNSFDEDLSGIERDITYEYVNLRQSPKKSAEVITQLNQGDIVTLTGNRLSYYMSEIVDPAGEWVEVTTADGITGWVVKNSTLHRIAN